MQWLIDNKEWVFSGAGIAILTAIIAVIRAIRKRGTKKENSSHISITQVNESGTGVTQIGVQKNYGSAEDKK